MKILLIADPYIPVPPQNYGGIERVIDMLCQGLSDIGHEVILIAHPESNTSAELIGFSSVDPFSKLGVIKNMAFVKKVINRIQPDIIHSFGRLANMILVARSSIPKIMSYQREPTLSRIKNYMQLSRNESIIFTGCSDYITNQIIRVAKAKTVYNGVPLGLYKNNPRVSIDAPLIFLGRVERIKGTHNAIEIARRSSRRLIIAGNIPDEDLHQRYYKQEVEPYLDENIKYVGPVNDTEKNSLLGKAAALLMPIEWNEPFGIVMAEALACGTPVIGPPRGSIPEIVQDGVNGFIRDTVEGMSDAVLQLSSISREECRKVFEERFSEHVIVDAYERLYLGMLHC